MKDWDCKVIVQKGSMAIANQRFGACSKKKKKKHQSTRRQVPLTRGSINIQMFSN